jgi:hypothetical protein
MARKKPSKSEFLSFDVLYEDGSRSSNRRIPSAALSDFDRDESIRAAIEAQDEKIALASGRPRRPIKAIVPSAA